MRVHERLPQQADPLTTPGYEEKLRAALDEVAREMADEEG